MKKILLIGSTGIIGKEIVKHLEGKVDLISASYSNKECGVDISDKNSIEELFKKVGNVDHIICVAGAVNFSDWKKQDDNDWEFGIRNKMMGQINLVRVGEKYINKGGSVTLSTGVLAQYPMQGGFIVTVVNAAVEAFINATIVELDKEDLRVNAVSPGWIKETMEAMGMDSTPGLPASEVAKVYINQIENPEAGNITVAMK